ncbi:DNA polymerase III subunit [Humisphaera borealis]|uniref:DNA polymerase III subunit delta n=1 Tax=Humisphaera borealis TaxID=2807512 RepID=A0A7M2WPP8_9BACT|nr:DNA polymerase III subunit delta' [Humisphaera borealis]QOV87495.1 DNA polymerase III subunit delta' [Humisphaera borealis]
MSTFSHIFGQSEAIHWLTRSYAADRLPHGLIFAGPAGVGKATTARAMGKLFLCQAVTGIEACGNCESCHLIDAGNHPDYHVVTKELIRFHDKTGKSKGISLSIDVVRPELIEPAGRKAVMGRGKVFVVEQADLMTAQAQNSLLKTLEEPAGRTLIMLLTDQPDALLQTIRSRSQMVRFAALDQAISAKELVRRGVDANLARKAASYANGSLGVSLKWIEDGVIEKADELSAMINTLFTGRPPDDLPAWLKASSDAYAKKQVERDPLGSEDQARREGIGLYLHLAGEVCRRRMAQVADGDTINEDALEQACAVVDALQRAETFLDANVNVSLVFQQLAVTLDRAARV